MSDIRVDTDCHHDFVDTGDAITNGEFIHCIFKCNKCGEEKLIDLKTKQEVQRN